MLRCHDALPLRDGATLYVRAPRSDDVARLRTFHASLSPRTLRFRFLHVMRELTLSEAEYLTGMDYANRMAVVATTGPRLEAALLAIVRYDRMSSEGAEVAFVVQDQWQGRGIATALLYRLAAYARTRGIATFYGFMLASNSRMLGVFHACGFPCTLSWLSDDEVVAQLDITAPPHPGL